MTPADPRPLSPLDGPRSGGAWAAGGALDPNVRALLLSGVAVSAALAIALGISLDVPSPNFLLLFALSVGALGLVALAVSSRLEVTVMLLALYLGCLDGPVKLLSVNQAASSVRDLLIGAVSLGALVRLLSRRERVRLPPLCGWVLAFVVLVVAEAFNPDTHGLLKVVGGFRQQLEWVPFFFFGYVLMRSKERLRALFIVLGVIALANGVVSAYQTRLTPAQLASWGPGYADRVNGTETLTARRYRASNGETLLRPPGLGSDSGFGAGVGVLALPGALALFAIGRGRRRWLAVPLCLGAMLAIATGLGRLQVVGGVIALVAFALLSLSAGRRATRPLGALLVFLALALPFAAVLAATEGSAVFSRYASIAPENVTTTSTSYKEKSLGLIPHYIASSPFGFGLATTGPASTFGGKVSEELEGHGITAETQYNYIVDELGAPGLILFVGLLLQLGVLVVRRLPRVPDLDVRIELAAVFAPVLAFAVMGLRGAFTDTSSAGPYLWFAVGTAAYWLAGPGRGLRRGKGVQVL
jgi:hypothetical protein